jgi:rod shape-determining protein MreC
VLQFLKTWRKFVVVPALILVSSLIWISNSREEKDRNILDRGVVTLTAPFQSVVSWALGGVKHVWYGYFYFVGLEASHEALLRENDELRGALAATWETAGENDRQRKDLAFEKDRPGTLVAASVIGADSASFAKSLRINRGSRHGIGRNMAVVTPSGVLGRVLEVSAFFSDVQLITDGRSAVPVRVQRTRAQGVLEGLGQGLCHLKYVSRAEDVQTGDVVVTSGLGGIFPRGIVAGTVVSVDKKEFGVLQEVQVAPAADFKRLPEEVLVVVQAVDTPEPDPKPSATPKSPKIVAAKETPKATATPTSTPAHGGPPDE